MPKLNKTAVDKAALGSKDVFLWCSDLKGFGLKVLTTGGKVFVLQYRTPEGRTKRFTIGRYSDALTCDQARVKAVALLLRIANGEDPASEKKERRVAITVGDLLDSYMASPAFTGKAATTRASDLGRIERHLRPLLGDKTADMLSGDAVRKAQAAITAGKTAVVVATKSRGLARVTGGAGTATKAVLLLRAAFNWAIAEGLLKENPCTAVKTTPPGQRDTIMDGAADYSAMFQTIYRMENEKRIRPAVADAIRFIALTGCRRGEVAALRWSYVDLTARRVSIPPQSHKTGRSTGKPRIIGLPAEAQAIIERQPAGEPDEYVFRPSKGEGVLSLAKPWRQVRKEANLPDGLGLHGLRHSLASHLAMAGASTTELMLALGHSQVSTTQRYVHFAEQARSTLAERGAAVAMAGLHDAKGTPKAPVLPLKKVQG